MIQPDGIIADSRFGFVEQFVVGLYHPFVEHSVLMRYRRVVYPQVDAAAEKGALHELLILVHERSRLAVVTLHEIKHQAVGILTGIPHEFCNHVGTQFGEITAFDTVDLREVHRHMIVLEQLNVRLQDMEVWEWAYGIVEIDTVVPYEDII